MVSSLANLIKWTSRKAGVFIVSGSLLVSGMTAMTTVAEQVGSTATTTSPTSTPKSATAVDGVGDSDGYHIRISTGDGSTWQDIAVVKPANLDESTWYGYQCITDDGKYVAVAILPASGENIAAQRFAGAYAYSVNIASGEVSALASGVGSFYFSPSCGTDDSATFTSSLGDQQQVTEVTRFDLATSKQVTSSVVNGQVTSAVGVGTHVYGVELGRIVDVPAGGTPSSPGDLGQPVVGAKGSAYDLVANSDGGLDFLTHDASGSDSTVWHWKGRQSAAALGAGPTTSLQLFAGAGGSTSAAGYRSLAKNSFVRGIATAQLPAGVSTVSLDGKSAFGPLPMSARNAATGAIQVEATTTDSDVGASENTSTHELRHSKFVASSDGNGSRSVAPSLPGSNSLQGEQSTTEPEHRATTSTGPLTRTAIATYTAASDVHAIPALSPGATTPTCAVARLSPTLQAMQPGNAQVSWAIEMAEQGYLTGSSSTRPSNFDNMGLASYSPSTDFPPISLSHPSGDTWSTVPRSVMEAVVAQESNFNQASWHALPGIAGDPLIADYYGAGGTITTINYPNADCGYGLAQVTTGMHATDTSITYHGQEKIAVDYQENVAEGLRILESTWNQLYAAGITANGGDPKYLENWYFAVWAYNTGIQPTAAFGNTTGCTPSATCTGPDGTWGLGWSNNPANPSYSPSRLPYLETTYSDASHPSSWPYEERIMGWMGSPIARYGYTAYTPPTYNGGSTWLQTAPFTQFCQTSMHCNPSTSTCSLSDSECWWHLPSTWISSCSTTCATSSYTAAAGSSEPTYTPPANRPVTKTCSIDPSVVPSSAIIVDDLATPSQNLAGCSGTSWTNSGTFSLAYGQNSSGDPIGSIDTHQLGAGLGGHVYFTHTEPASSTSLSNTGTWAPTLPSTQYYKIKIHLPATGAVATDVVYTVHPGGGGTATGVRVNQDWGSEQWVTIGTFAMSTGGSLTLSNASSMTPGKYDVAFDAVAFIPEGGTPGIPVGGAPTIIDAPSGSNPAWVQCGCGKRTAGDPVDTSTGYFGQTFSDVSTAGRGLPFQVTRIYSSALADPAGPSGVNSVSGAFGPGWTYSYGMTATTDAGTGNVTVLQADGSRVFFTLAGATYTPQLPRFQATLTKSGSTLTYTRRGNEVYQFDTTTGHETAAYDLAGWVATPRYGDQMSYDGSGNLHTVTDPGGRVYTFGWTGSHITSLTTSGGQEVDYNYNASGQLTDVYGVGTLRPGGVNGNQDHAQYAYFSSNLMSTLRTPANYGKSGSPLPVTSMVYDSSERVTSQTDPTGNVTSFVYGPNTGLGLVAGQTLVTDGAGHEDLQTYTSGLLTSDTKGYGSPVAKTWTYTYDPISLGVSQTTQPDGGVETFSYDDNGNLASSSDALGRTTEFLYDSSGNLLQKTTPDLIQTTMVYNSADARTSVTIGQPGQSAESSNSNPSPTVLRSTLVTYPSAAHPADPGVAKDFDGNPTTYSFDSSGDLTSKQDAAGNTTKYGWDTSRGLLTTQVSPMGVASGTTVACTPPALGCTTFAHDAWGNVTVTTDPLGHTTQSSFDADGNKVSSVDGDGQTTTTTFDAADRPILVAQPIGSITTTYNGDGSVHTSTDRAGHVTTYTYDGQGRLSTTTDADGKVSQVGYDSNGNVNSRVDPNGTTTSFSFDTAGQLSSIAYSGTLSAHSVTFTYDSGARRLTMSDATGTSTYAYDSFGEMISATTGAGSSVGYTYDAQGNQTSISYPGTGGTVAKAFNNLNQLASVTDAAGRMTTFGYDADGRESLVTYPNSTTETVGYNNAAQVTSVALAHGTTASAGYTYTRDSAGNETGSTPTSGAAGVATTYGYDSNEQVRSSTASGVATPTSYDSAGNPTTVGATTEVFDSADRLCWSTTTSVTGPTCGSPVSGSTIYASNSDGQRTSKTPSASATSTYSWNGAGELSAVSGATTASYVYDGDGLRASKTVGGTTTTFTWTPGASTPLLLSDGTENYIYGPTGAPVEQTGAAGASPQWYFADAQRSTAALTDLTGSIVGTYSYTVHGGVATHTGSASSPIEFAGEYTDPETGFIYLRARYYDPATALFISSDPALASTAFAFVYASNNPLDAFDPTGLWDVWDVVAVAGIVLAMVALAATGVGLAADAGIIAAAVGTVEVSTVAGGVALGASVAGGVLDTASCANGDGLGCAGVAANIAGGGLAGAGLYGAGLGLTEGGGYAAVAAPYAIGAYSVDIAGGAGQLAESQQRENEATCDQLRKDLNLK